MTDLNFRQEYTGSDSDHLWVGMKTYQLTPWPDYCTITYYDFGFKEVIIKGERTRFDWENGSAEYEALEGGLDVRCKLLQGSTWRRPDDPTA